MKIAIQGNKGSYSHIAAAHIFEKEVEITEHATFDTVFEDLEAGDVDAIVIPIENSTHGSVYQNYDNISKYDFRIVGELYLKINFHLITHPDVTIDQLDSIYSHPVGLNQIRQFLRDHSHIKPREFDDTAGSVAMIKKQVLKNAAAAASRFAADLYGMEILRENIQENSKNYTRFFVLTNNTNEESIRSFVPEHSASKTTIQFILGEEPGSLYKSLRCFADRDISLSKIESRPILNTDWQYRFYVDINSSTDDEKVQNAMREVKDYVKELRVLGSYNQGTYLET